MRAAKVDVNQRLIVAELEASLGAGSVAITATVGAGFPDIVVGWGGVNYLFEIKSDGKPEGNADSVAEKWSLTPDQRRFFSRWAGQVHIIKDADAALRVMGGAIVKKCDTCRSWDRHLIPSDCLSWCGGGRGSERSWPPHHCRSQGIEWPEST